MIIERDFPPPHASLTPAIERVTAHAPDVIFSVERADGMRASQNGHTSRKVNRRIGSGAGLLLVVACAIPPAVLPTLEGQPPIVVAHREEVLRKEYSWVVSTINHVGISQAQLVGYDNDVRHVVCTHRAIGLFHLRPCSVDAQFIKRFVEGVCVG